MDNLANHPKKATIGHGMHSVAGLATRKSHIQNRKSPYHVTTDSMAGCLYGHKHINKAKIHYKIYTHMKC